MVKDRKMLKFVPTTVAVPSSVLVVASNTRTVRLLAPTVPERDVVGARETRVNAEIWRDGEIGRGSWNFQFHQPGLIGAATARIVGEVHNPDRTDRQAVGSG